MSKKASAKWLDQLSVSLPGSTGADLRVWAKRIVDEDIDLVSLLPLLRSDQKTATRLLWMLSDVGAQDPGRLSAILPALFNQRNELSHLNLPHSLTRYWILCGIPPEHEAPAIDLLFQWLASPKITVHVKSGILKVLEQVVKRYPELQEEFVWCIQDQLGKNSATFDKQARRLLVQYKQP